MRARAHAKINLALAVGSPRPDGKHEIVTVLEHLELHDLLELERADAEGVLIEGFTEDTLVRHALELLAALTETPAQWRVRLDKRIPIAAGLGGGSSDAAAALRLANAQLPRPLSEDELVGLAARVGADVPFFLAAGPRLGMGDGSELTSLDLPQDYTVVLALPHDERKESTAAVYRGFDARRGERGFVERREALLETLRSVKVALDLGRLPRNDLCSSVLAAELELLGAFRADVSGAGPMVYALFEDEGKAEAAARGVTTGASTWLTRPASAD